QASILADIEIMRTAHGARRNVPGDNTIDILPPDGSIGLILGSYGAVVGSECFDLQEVPSEGWAGERRRRDRTELRGRRHCKRLHLPEAGEHAKERRIIGAPYAGPHRRLSERKYWIEKGPISRAQREQPRCHRFADVHAVLCMFVIREL